MSTATPSNQEIAAVLERIAELLEAQDADRFRIRAYRRAAETIRRYAAPVAAIASNVLALESLPTVGSGIARTIAQFVTTGRTTVLDRLEGQVSAEHQFARIPGIGEMLADKIHRALHVETLEELELAAHDGRLDRLNGIGPRRLLAIKNALNSLLGQRRYRAAAESRQLQGEPSVEVLLEIDALYRERAEAGELKMIAPKRFNPEREAWLPIMHVERDGWQFSALFSNTLRAHELSKTHDWVVIYYERDGDGTHGQATVVSESQGKLKGRRVVRGRESECAGVS